MKKKIRIYGFKKCSSNLLIVIAMLLFRAMTVQAEITGSAHDFSDKEWSGNKICLPCHTPHNADPTVDAAPLWNHSMTTANYILYGSTTLKVDPGQPDGISKLCLSCHDGTVAIDSFGDQTGSNFISDSADVSTDLSDDHPVSINWKHQFGGPGIFAGDPVISNFDACVGCHKSSCGGPGSCHSPNPETKLPFFNTPSLGSGKSVECASCHDPHNNAPEKKMLRVSLSSSELCLLCHIDKQ